MGMDMRSIYIWMDGWTGISGGGKDWFYDYDYEGGERKR